MVLGATLSNNWGTFTAFRSLQGLFGTVPQVIGLPIIHDMYAPNGKSISASLLVNVANFYQNGLAWSISGTSELSRTNSQNILTLPGVRLF